LYNGKEVKVRFAQNKSVISRKFQFMIGLTLLRNPLSIDAALTDKDLGILIGFSRITE